MRSPLLPSFVSVLFVAFTACGGCQKDESTPDSDQFASRGLALNAAEGCSIDTDCVAGRFCWQDYCAWECAGAEDCDSGELCSPRGRCHLEGVLPRDAVVETVTNVTVVAPPNTLLEVTEGDVSVTISFGIAGDLPEDRLSYRVDRSDGFGDPSALLQVSVPEQQVEIDIPLGDEGAAALFGDEATGYVDIRLATTIGEFHVTLLPKAELDGEWAGELKVDAFGGQAFDLAFSLIGDSPDEMKVVLPVEGRTIFAPRNDNDASRRYEIADLVFNDTTQVYQAIFAYEYRFEDGLFGGLRRQIERTIRLDIDADALRRGSVVGRFSDTWRGLFNAQSQAGVETVGSLGFVGEFAMGRQGDRPADSAPTASVATVSPTLLDEGALAACSAPQFEAVPNDGRCVNGTCGDACATTADCAANANCVDTDGDTTPDTCAAACTSDEDCLNASACSADSTGTGVADTCAPLSCSADAECAGVNIDRELYSCTGIGSVAEFANAGPVGRVKCAVALAHNALSGDTTQLQLGAYFSDTGPGAGAPSFEDFLAACADDGDMRCTPSMGARCGFELTAYAAKDVTLANLGDDAATANGLLTALLTKMSDSASEAFLARQLGAFYTDMDLRRSWLANSTAPGVFLGAVEAENLKLMDTWQSSVLDVQRDVFVQFFQRDALTLLGRTVEGDVANERRVKLLSEAGVLWRAYSGALTLVADRWATIIRDEADRAEKVAYLQSRSVELYLVMGMLIEFNRAAGANFEGALLAQGFAQLTRSLERLSTPHAEMIFARDAEIVTARSLNPLSDNTSLLTERRERALKVTDESRETIDGILTAFTVEAVNREFLTGRLETEGREAADQLAKLCGLPSGCDAANILSDPTCDTVDLGLCGGEVLYPPTDRPVNSLVVPDGSGVTVSQGGRAILGVLGAFHTAKIEQAELEGHLSKLQLSLTELEAYAADIKKWDEARKSNHTLFKANIARRETIRGTQYKNLVDNLSQRATKRQALLDTLQADAASWNVMRVDQASTNYRKALAALGLTTTGEAAERAGNTASIFLKAAADALPTIVGPSSDPNAPARAGLLLKSRYASLFGAAAKTAFGTAAAMVQQEAKLHADLTAAELSNLAEVQQIEKAEFEQAIVALSAELEKDNKLANNELADLEELIELAHALLEIDEKRQRDHAEWRVKNTAYQHDFIDTTAKKLRLARTMFGISQKLAEYDGVVFAARLERARLAQVTQQLNDQNVLIGGAAAVFSQTYELERAEAELAESRKALMDWLVVLEYYAVRPFIAQRIQILLARNAFQLSAIASDLERLEAECGGSEQSHSSETLSLRTDVLGLTRGLIDEVDDSDVDADQRFHRLMRESFVPVNRLVRYSTEASLPKVLDQSGTLALPFTIDMDAFGNLSLACNAKIEKVAVQLVGELGEGQPTVTIIYDGVSQLRSCQPNVDDYVGAFGNGMSGYGSVTLLRTSGRVMSPLAGVNAFIPDEDQENASLSGLPIASDYTLLIDTTSAANAKFDWTALKDVLIQVDYTHQDLFPTACE